MIFCSAGVSACGKGLEIKNPGTRLAYIARDGRPLLAFGCHLEHMFLADNRPDYTVWSDWAQAHGINHCRVRVIQPRIGDKYKPYQSVATGRYDLKRFDPLFWHRLREIRVNLRDHGIIMHFLIFPHNGHVRSNNWHESLFNPDHNVNAETQHLGGSDHYKFWHSVADKQTGLWDIQRAAVVKIVESTADLDNIYCDLSHEFRTDFCGAQHTDWSKAEQFFDAVADTLRTKYMELLPGKKPLVGLDAEHFAKAGQRDWNFRNPAFDLMILGNSSISPVPPVETVISWRKRYSKPFLLQEGGADDDRGGKTGISYSNTDPAIVRKYIWKWMMAKNRLIDIYQKQLDDGYPDNYDPWGHSGFEDDALILREFWNTLTDCPNLDYVGVITAGPGHRKMVLSSGREALAYMASRMGEVGRMYSWLSSVVWNEGLGLYIMVNGGTYAGHGMTASDKDYCDSWMHTRTGSLGFWYSQNPWGPWRQFYYTDYWTVDDPKNRTYQPKLSPKWISEGGREMVLIWSDAMKNDKGRSHTVNYKWNQMKITIQLRQRVSAAVAPSAATSS